MFCSLTDEGQSGILLDIVIYLYKTPISSLCINLLDRSPRQKQTNWIRQVKIMKEFA
jgi:hypothetical protein